MILMNVMIEIQHVAWMKLMSTSIWSYLEDWLYRRSIWSQFDRFENWIVDAPRVRSSGYTSYVTDKEPYATTESELIGGIFKSSEGTLSW